MSSLLEIGAQFETTQFNDAHKLVNGGSISNMLLPYTDPSITLPKENNMASSQTTLSIELVYFKSLIY